MIGLIWKLKWGSLAKKHRLLQFWMVKTMCWNKVSHEMFLILSKFFYKVLLFFLRCQDERHSKLIWNSIQSNPKLLFISCIYKDQILNHLDFEKFFKLDSSVYQDLLFQLDKKTEFSLLLQENSNLQSLILTQHHLLPCLKMFKL